MTDAIRIEKLRLGFNGRILLDDFSLRVPAGGRCTVTGPSGCGKSTLLACVLGFARPMEGAIELLGQSLNRESVWELRRKIAWVPQEPDVGTETGRDFLDQPFGFRANRTLAPDNEAVTHLLTEFQLRREVLDQPVSELSGGEKQRLALIAALLLRRPILLLDEASSALDRKSREAVAAHLRGMTDVSIVSVAHEPENFVIGGPVLRIGAREGGNGAD